MKTYINASQLRLLQYELQKRNVDYEKFYNHYNIKHLCEMSEENYNDAMERLSSRPYKPDYASYIVEKEAAHKKINYHLEKIHETIFKNMGISNAS